MHTMPFIICALLLFAAPALGAVKTESVEYSHGGTTFEGYLAWDDALAGKRPGVLVIHEWWGVNDYVRMRAKELAGMGYAAFAGDMYGKGLRASTPEEARRLSSAVKGDRGLMRARVRAALDVLSGNPLVDPARLAAIGYCFGGTTVLELARSGAPVAGVVSFHGGLDTPAPADAKNIRGKVLVLTGADDPAVPPAQVAAFMEEMRAARVDWYMTSYGGAVHAFTNPASGTDPSRGVAYNAAADARSFQAMRDFFGELFGSR